MKSVPGKDHKARWSRHIELAIWRWEIHLNSISLSRKWEHMSRSKKQEKVLEYIRLPYGQSPSRWDRMYLQMCSVPLHSLGLTKFYQCKSFLEECTLTNSVFLTNTCHSWNEQGISCIHLIPGMRLRRGITSEPPPNLSVLLNMYPC